MILCDVLLAQNVTIKGKVHSSHKNKVIELYSYTDLITYTQTKEAADSVDENGYFELSIKIEETCPVILKIDNLYGKLYIQPDYIYGVGFPEKDPYSKTPVEIEERVDISIFSADTTELNNLIIDFNKQYNKLFVSSEYEFLNKNRIYKKLDSLKLSSVVRYAQIKNKYFKNYLLYTFASLNANALRGKNYLKENYILNKPVLHNNYEYMEFFNAYFKGYLDAYSSTKPNENVYHLINTVGRYDEIDTFLKSDNLLKNDTLRELVIIKNLWDYYYSPNFEKQNVLMVIEQFRDKTKIIEHKKIADNIIKVAYQLQPGAKAPVFTTADKTGKKVSLSDFKGRYVYLNFFSTKSIESMKEMQKINDLYKKYADKVTFISICTDDSIKLYKEYLKANPKYPWLIAFNNSETKGSTAKDLYYVKGLPAFYFINNYGNILQSPAISPSQGFEYKLKALFKPKKGNTKTGIR